MFIGLGVTELSVAPRAMASLRAGLAGLDLAACRNAAREALGEAEAADVRAVADRLLAGPVPAPQARVSGG